LKANIHFTNIFAKEKIWFSVVFAICYLQNGMVHRRENNLLSISCSPVKFTRRQLGFANAFPHPLKALDKK
jgi:hypothetical protein